MCRNGKKILKGGLSQSSVQFLLQATRAVRSSCPTTSDHNFPVRLTGSHRQKGRGVKLRGGAESFKPPPSRRAVFRATARPGLMSARSCSNDATARSLLPNIALSQATKPPAGSCEQCVAKASLPTGTGPRDPQLKCVHVHVCG